MQTVSKKFILEMFKNTESVGVFRIHLLNREQTSN